MRSTLYFAVPILSAALAFAADRPDDAKSIQGAWTPSKAELGGKPMPDAVLKTIKLKLDNGKYEASVAGKLDIGTYTLDVASKPKGMTVNGTEGPNKGKSFPPSTSWTATRFGFVTISRCAAPNRIQEHRRHETLCRDLQAQGRAAPK